MDLRGPGTTRGETDVEGNGPGRTPGREQESPPRPPRQALPQLGEGPSEVPDGLGPPCLLGPRTGRVADLEASTVPRRPLLVYTGHWRDSGSPDPFPPL